MTVRKFRVYYKYVIHTDLSIDIFKWCCVYYYVEQKQNNWSTVYMCELSFCITKTKYLWSVKYTDCEVHRPILASIMTLCMTEAHVVIILPNTWIQGLSVMHRAIIPVNHRWINHSGISAILVRTKRDITEVPEWVSGRIFVSTVYELSPLLTRTTMGFS